MCGGTIEVAEGQKVVTCEYCGATQTVHSFDNEKKNTFFKRAEALRFKCEFDKAAGIYETIVSEFPNEAEAYWGLVLCKYGIEYVDDPKTGNKIPTCHRTQFSSIYDDSDYQNVLKHADAVAKVIYEKEAKEISKLQKSILDISSKEDPFDIFICYKENDGKGNRTKDSVLAQDIYDELISKGYRVFFSRITLEDKLGTQYEPYIFAALHSAKVMLHVTTSDENSESVWVRNEWSRFLSLIADGQKKTLIPCYKEITPYDLPEEMQNLQGQDMSKLGAMQDLLRGIDKILSRKATTKVETKTIVETRGTSSSYEGLVKKGHTYLKNNKFEEADRTFDEAIRIGEMPGEAYLGKVLAEYQFRSIEEVMESASEEVVDCDNFTLAKEFANKEFAETLKEIEDKVRYNRLKENYDSAMAQYNRGDLESLSLATDNFKVLEDFEDSPTMVKECIYKTGLVYLGMVTSISNLSYCENATKCFEDVIDFKNSREMITKVAETRNSIVESYKNSCLSKLVINYPKDVTNGSLKTLADKVLLNRSTIKTFSPLYKDILEKQKEIEAEADKFIVEKSPALIDTFSQKSQCSNLRQICKSIEVSGCFKSVYELLNKKENEINEIAKAIARKRRKKTLKISAIVCGALAVAVAAFFGIKAIVDENNRKATYATAEKAMESGNYDDAIAYYESLGNYQESQKKIKVCEGLKQLETSITTKKEADAIKGIKTIVSAGEKVDVAYETENNVNIKRLAGGNSGNKTETIDNVNFTFYQPTWNGYTFLNWNSNTLSYKDDRTHLGLMSNWSLNSYTITYNLDVGTNNSSNPKKYSVESETFDLLEPTKEHYVFKGWRLNSSDGELVTKIEKGTFGNLSLYATWEIVHLNVRFFNEDVLLDTVSVPYGGTAEYTKSTPTKEADAEFTYTFTGWDKVLTNVTESFDTYAQYSSTVNSYKVTFYDYDGTTELDSSYVEYGSNAVYTKETPTRATDDNYVYTFSGWDKPLSTVITGPTSFIAQYSTTNRYLCRFFVEGVETYSTRVTEGDGVEYKGEYPTKTQTAEYVFDFDHWDKSLENITENTDFNAVFNYIPREYEVKYVNWDGTELLKTSVAYGCYSSYSGNTPTRATDNDYVYTFSGWDKSPSATPIVEDTVFTAQYSTTDRFLCIFVNYDGTELYREYVTQGENANYVGSTPTKEGTQQYSYVFAGWDKPLTNIQLVTTFTAQFNEVTNQYTVTFVNWDGSALGSDTVDYGTSASYSGSTPTRPVDNQYKYTFSGWDISLSCITSDVTATAQYSTTDRFLCVFNNYDGTELYSEYVTQGEDANYVGDVPTKPRTQQYSYSFTGWDKPLTNIQTITTFNQPIYCYIC